MVLRVSTRRPRPGGFVPPLMRDRSAAVPGPEARGNHSDFPSHGAASLMRVGRRGKGAGLAAYNFFRYV